MAAVSDAFTAGGLTLPPLIEPFLAFDQLLHAADLLDSHIGLDLASQFHERLLVNPRMRQVHTQLLTVFVHFPLDQARHPGGEVGETLLEGLTFEQKHAPLVLVVVEHLR